MIQELVKRAGRLGYRVKLFSPENSLWIGMLVNSDGVEIYQFETTGFYDLGMRLMDVIGQLNTCSDTLREEITKEPLVC